MAVKCLVISNNSNQYWLKKWHITLINCNTVHQYIHRQCSVTTQKPNCIVEYSSLFTTNSVTQSHNHHDTQGAPKKYPHDHLLITRECFKLI